MIDGDRFKYVNDTYGHMIGDEVIKLCAQMIIGRIRTIDLASRLHGDEFAIFIANIDDCLLYTSRFPSSHHDNMTYSFFCIIHDS